MFPLFEGKRNPEVVREEVQREATHLRRLKLDPEANTENYPASTEVNDVMINLSRTMTWATGAIATQRSMYLKAPELAFAGPSTITKAATLAISGAPVAGANATILSSYALWLQSGASRFDGYTEIENGRFRGILRGTVQQNGEVAAYGATLVVMEGHALASAVTSL